MLMAGMGRLECRGTLWGQDCKRRVAPGEPELGAVFRGRFGAESLDWFESLFSHQERFKETLGALERLKEVLIIEMPALIQDCLEVSGRSLELGVLISQCD